MAAHDKYDNDILKALQKIGSNLDKINWSLAAETMENLVGSIAARVTETEDAFIFQTLSDFASANYQITVDKSELVRAIQLIRMSKEYGPSIAERWTTATQQSEWYRHAYNRGFQDGVKKEREEIDRILHTPRKLDETVNKKYLVYGDTYFEGRGAELSFFWYI